MIFADRIKSIRPSDKVLEIGPGSTPHVRSNAFLELSFSSEAEKLAQRGGGVNEGKFGNRPVHYYDGGRFPFNDREFDYVICSHVIEHVPEPAQYLAEVFRVSRGRGYIEYPLITYEYLYNFDVHLHFVKFDPKHRVLRYLPKQASGFGEFSAVQAIFYQTLVDGWDDLCAANPTVFFEGFEYLSPFSVAAAETLDELVPLVSLVRAKRPMRRMLGRVMNKLGF